MIGPGTEWGKTLVPAAVEAFQYNGKDYGIPLYLDAKFMGYNKAIFQKLGIADPKSFEELLSRLRHDQESRHHADLARQQGSLAGRALRRAAPRLQRAAGDLEQDFDPKTAKYTDPGYVAALEAVQGSSSDHCIDAASVNGTSYATALQQFGNGKSAMYYQEIIEFDQSTAADGGLKPADFGFFVLPVPDGCQGRSQGGRRRARGLHDQHGLEEDAAGHRLHEVRDLARRTARSCPRRPTASRAPRSAAPRRTTMSPAVVAGSQGTIKSASYLMPWLDTANSAARRRCLALEPAGAGRRHR